MGKENGTRHPKSGTLLKASGGIAGQITTKTKMRKLFTNKKAKETA
jgi:hypothetical protein